MKDTDKRQFQKYFAITLIIILIVFILYFLYPYLSGFFLAFVIFILFLPLFNLLTNKLKINKQLAAIIIILLTIIIIIIPSYFIITRTYTEIVSLANNPEGIISFIHDIDLKIPYLNLAEKISVNNLNIASWGEELLFKSIKNLAHLAITLIIMLFTLYYLFVNHKEIRKKLIHNIPFTNRNSKHYLTQFKKITFATIIAAGLVAIIQGILLGIVLFLFGVPNPFIWGMIGAIFAVLPVMDIFVVYVPIAIYYLSINNYTIGIGLLICGALISASDYLLRPFFQKKFGDIHPLISIVGVIIGIPAFGFVGIIIGPLLISYLLLACKMFEEEYLEKK